MSDANQPPADELNERLEAYLDGLLSPEEAAEFKRIAASDPLLQREIELQGEIDSSLGRIFVEPASAPDILTIAQNSEAGRSEVGDIEPARRERVTKSPRRAVLVALAACVAWAIVGWRMYVASTDDGYEQLALADIYERCVDNGFKPKWVCDDDREFAETFQKRQGQPLLLNPDAQDVMVGLSYLKGLSAQTTTMLARVDGEPILVFVDRLDRDSDPEKPSWGSGLNLFRKELDSLVLYELSPLAESRVLASFYIPEELPVATAEGADDNKSERIEQ